MFENMPKKSPKIPGVPTNIRHKKIAKKLVKAKQYRSHFNLTIFFDVDLRFSLKLVGTPCTLKFAHGWNFWYTMHYYACFEFYCVHSDAITRAQKVHKILWVIFLHV